MNEELRHFSLRKLSVGLASVLVGVSVFGTSQVVKADTVANSQVSTVTSNAQSSNTQENQNTVKLTLSSDNQVDNAKSNLIQTQVEGKNEQTSSSNQNQHSFVSKMQEVTDSNDSQKKDAEKDIVRTSSLQEPDNQSNNHAEDNSQTQNEQKLDLTKNSKKFAKKVLATNLIETNSLATTNGGFDEATWGKLDVNDWRGQARNGVYELINYTGDPNHVIVPNEADFEKAGKSTNGLQVGIASGTTQSLVSNRAQTIAFSKTNNQKVKAIGTDWSKAFSSNTGNTARLSKFDGSSLDVSKVTDMSAMFENGSISDLTSLADWGTSNVTDMSNMFYHNSISDLKPLANWDTSKVTDMSAMFAGNSISDLTPLINWKTSKVTDMNAMFVNNSINDLKPLANWDTSKVTDMSWMFVYNSISDLTPLKHWNTSKVTNMSWMFENNSISDLTPLAHWDTSKVTNMNHMFYYNSIRDLTSVANWNTSSVTDISYMFSSNYDLIDLKPIANWNISSVKDNSSLFFDDPQLNLTNINNTPLMQGFLKTPNALRGAVFITNNADLVKATISKDLPNLTNTAKRTIVFNIPNTAPTKIVQTINYKTITTVQVDFDIKQIVKTYPVKESDWQLDTSKQNDDVIIDGVICFKPVKIPHINGYKAYIVPNKLNPASFTVSFMAIPTETKPSNPIEETPSKPSAPADNPNKPAGDLQQRVVTKLNSNDSGWTMPTTADTHVIEVPTDSVSIDLSNLAIAQPVHARTRTQIHVTKHFKLRKHNMKRAIKHLKHRKRVSKLFGKRYALL